MADTFPIRGNQTTTGSGSITGSLVVGDTIANSKGKIHGKVTNWATTHIGPIGSVTTPFLLESEHTSVSVTSPFAQLSSELTVNFVSTPTTKALSATRSHATTSVNSIDQSAITLTSNENIAEHRGNNVLNQLVGQSTNFSNGPGTITLGVNTWIKPPTNTGTITQMIGLYIEGQKVGTQTKGSYSLFQGGTNDFNHFSGKTSFGYLNNYDVKWAPVEIYNDPGTNAQGIVDGLKMVIDGSGGSHATGPAANDSVGLYIWHNCKAGRTRTWAINTVSYAQAAVDAEINCYEADISNYFGDAPQPEIAMHKLGIDVASGGDFMCSVAYYSYRTTANNGWRHFGWAHGIGKSGVAGSSIITTPNTGIAYIDYGIDLRHAVIQNSGSAFRAPNNVNALVARNAANTADVLIAKVDSSNQVVLGSASNPTVNAGASGPYYDARAWGVVADVAMIEDLQTVNTSNVINAASGPFLASDVGKKIALFGGYTFATITQFNSATQVVIDVVAGFTFTRHNAQVLRTDNSTALENAIAAMPAEGGVLLLPKGGIRITRPLSLNKPIILQGAGSGGAFHDNSDLAQWATGTTIMLDPAVNTGRQVTDGAMTSGSANLTSATIAWTANDVGNWVIVPGALAGGKDLVARIITFTSATSVVLSETATATVSAKTIRTGPDIIRINTSYVSSADRGKQISGIQIRDLGLHGMHRTFRGLVLERASQCVVENVWFREMNTTIGIGIHLVTMGVLANQNCDHNRIESVFMWRLPTPIRMDGSRELFGIGNYGISNCCHNFFSKVAAAYTENGLWLEDSDNNSFFNLMFFRHSGTGKGVVSRPWSRANYFYHLQSPGFDAQAPDAAAPNGGSAIFGYDRENGQEAPTLATGASLDWTETGAQSTGWTIKQYRSKRYVASGTAIDWTNGNVQELSLTASVTLTFAGGLDGSRLMLVVKQDATGNRQITWPANVKWPGGTAPTLSGANKTDLITFMYDGTNYYAGSSLNY